MQTNLNADEVALSILQMVSESGVDGSVALEAIVRMSASSVIGGACDRRQLFAMISDYLDKMETN